jgi:hypothetical protein
MLILTLNAAFAALFAAGARLALTRAVPFLRAGWIAIAAGVRQPDYRAHVESRRLISEGGAFVIGGIAWGAIGIGALILALTFALRALGLS